jgi:hypothetical protein
MLSIDTIVDHSATTTKQALSFIPNQEVRHGFESLVDAQANFTKAVFTTTTDLGKIMYDSVIATLPKQAPVSKK